jgi:hypothetical protein
MDLLNVVSHFLGGIQKMMNYLLSTVSGFISDLNVSGNYVMYLFAIWAEGVIDKSSRILGLLILKSIWLPLVFYGHLVKMDSIGLTLTKS